MERLRLTDLHRVSGFLRKVYAVRDEEAFPGRAVAALREVVPATIVSYNEVNTRRRRVRAVVDPPDAPADGQRIFAEHMHEHPMLAHDRRTGDGRALKISDFLSHRQFHRLGLYQDYYRRVRTEYQMSTTLPAARSRVIALALSRDSRDFSERDRAVLDLVRPHLAQAYRMAEAATGLQRDFDLLSRGVERCGLGIVALDRDTRVLLMTASARLALAEHFGRRPCAAQSLPADVARWVVRQRSRLEVTDDVVSPLRPLVLSRSGQRLVIHLFPGDGPSEPHILYLEAQPSRTAGAMAFPGLTPRESQVLGWVARGKTNADIGTILGISDKTVDKHLEHIFLKLGVETRTAAVAAVFEWPPLLPD